MAQFEKYEYQNFRKIVAALQIQPPAGLVRSFIFTGPSTPGLSYCIPVEIDSLILVPLLEAIGMRLKYCLERSLEAPGEALFEGDRILDACQLLKMLARIITALERVGEPISAESFDLIQAAHTELGRIAERVLQTWDDIEPT